jgi:hypothetical protein
MTVRAARRRKLQIAHGLRTFGAGHDAALS